MKTSDRNRAILAEVTARSWRQPEFRTELKADPKKALKAAGMEIPDETEIVIAENTLSVMYVVLPPIADQAKYQARMDKEAKRIGDLPEGLELRIVRDSAKKVFIAIPVIPAEVSTGKLSDAALEQVAGGKTGQSTVQTQVTVSTTVQTAEVLTTEAQTMETTTTFFAEVEVCIVPCFIS